MKRKYLFYILFMLIISVPSMLLGQVTIGSNHTPNKGALLDLKEKEDGSSNKGLAMPRVLLTAYNDLTVDSGDAAEQAHVGLVVYNVNTIEDNEETRLCPGLHVWDGKRWEPLIPYPEGEKLIPLAGPLGTFQDSRDGEVYHYARFHSVKSASASCSSTGEGRVIDAGVWMTQNLRYSGIELKDSYLGSSITMYYTKPNPNDSAITDERRSRDGYLYNWAAATDRKGGETGKDFNIDEGVGEDGALAEIKRTGICPEGWHLPTATEWAVLLDAIKLQPELYAEVEGLNTVDDSNVGFVLMGKETEISTFKGKSKAYNEGGFDGLPAGHSSNGNPASSYGESAGWWTSSSMGSSNAYAAIFLTSSDTSHGELNGETVGSVRPTFRSVRCKKND